MKVVYMRKLTQDQVPSVSSSLDCTSVAAYDLDVLQQCEKRMLQDYVQFKQVVVVSFTVSPQYYDSFVYWICKLCRSCKNIFHCIVQLVWSFSWKFAVQRLINLNIAPEMFHSLYSACMRFSYGSPQQKPTQYSSSESRRIYLISTLTDKDSQNENLYSNPRSTVPHDRFVLSFKAKQSYGLEYCLTLYQKCF